MYKTNLIRSHQYFSGKKEYKTVWDLNLAELIVLEQTVLQLVISLLTTTTLQQLCQTAILN